MAFMSTVFLFPTSPTTTVQDMNYTVAVFGGVMLLSLIYYFFPKYGGMYWFTGPVTNVSKKSESAEGSFEEHDKKSLDKVDVGSASDN